MSMVAQLDDLDAHLVSAMLESLPGSSGESIGEQSGG
jgi:hypothetical protein